MGCCSPHGLDDIFGERTARFDVMKYRRRGLDRRAELLLDAVRARVSLHDAVALEAGAGVAPISVEMLRRGLERAVAVDAVSAAMRGARRLAELCDVAARLETRVDDFATMHGDERFDIVVMDRVVCCYPDWRGLLDAAARRAERVIGFSYPREAWWTGAFVGATNIGMRILRRDFRLNLHPPAAMHARLHEHGFAVAVVGHRGAWEIAVATRG